MEPNSLPTVVILSQSCDKLGRLYLDWEPQPGMYLEVEDQAYLVLERRHRYLLKNNRYHLNEVVLYVQAAPVPSEKSLFEGRWILGDLTCQYNAHSELIRCAVNPNGPCDRCVFYQVAEG